MIRDTFDFTFLVNIVGTKGCETNGGNVKNKPCAFPFIYKGDSYQTCTKKDHDVDWCYTEVDSYGVGVRGRWGNCGPGCFSMSNP